MDEHNELRTRLCAVGMELFRRDGLRFTMQQAAAMMHISKKTIYAVYPSKEALLLDMVDDAFTRIHARKQRILDGPGTLAEKLRAVIIALPEEYTALDLQQMDLLDEKYPRVAARVREHLETGGEPTLALLEQAMGEGVIRRVSLPVLQRMISASIEDFLADRALDTQGISYTDALDEMISILLEGLLVRGDTVFAITGNLQSNGAMPSVGVNLLAVVRCVCLIPAGSCRSTTQTPLTMRWSAVTVAH